MQRINDQSCITICSLYTLSAHAGALVAVRDTRETATCTKEFSIDGRKNGLTTALPSRNTAALQRVGNVDLTGVQPRTDWK